MSSSYCRNCDRDMGDDEHHVGLPASDGLGCLRVRLEVLRDADATHGFRTESSVLGLAPQRKAARIIPLGSMAM